MRKTIKHKKGKNISLKKQLIDKVIILIFFAMLIITISWLTFFNTKDTMINDLIRLNLPEKMRAKGDISIRLLITGDILLDRHIDALSQKSPLKYAYPFSKLDTLDKKNYDMWIGNLECPVTVSQSTMYEKKNYLKFSCKKEYLSELKKYFDIVSLANNHTDNMSARSGITETRKHLDDAGIKYFGDYDNSQSENVCSIVSIKNIPIAFCGFHGVYKLPTEKEISILDGYSKYFVTIVMPHQGEEYKTRSNSFQQKVYKSFVDHGADVVFGSHPHVIQEVSEYKGKLIFYSLGNFIFDQASVATRKHMAVQTHIVFPKYNDSYKDLNCKNKTALECLKLAESLNISKPEYSIKYKPVFTDAGTDFLTKESDLTGIQYQDRLKAIDFDKVEKLLKI